MDRRAFLIQAAKASAAALAVSAGGVWLAGRRPETHVSLFEIPDYSIPASNLTKDVVVVHGDDAEKLVQTALQALGGIEKFIHPDDRVLLKPNVGFDRPPELGATTSPDVVAAVVTACLAAGARDVYVTDNPINSPSASFARSGIEEATKRAGGKILILTNSDFEEASIGGTALDRWSTAVEPLRKVDKVIGIPTLKDHNLSGMSFAMKNWYGLLGTGRNRFHQDIHNVIADLAMMIKPTLIIGDATRILTRNGPTGGSPADVRAGNTLIVSPDAVAVDAFGVELLERPIEDIDYIGVAAARGIGSDRPRALRFEEVTL